MSDEIDKLLWGIGCLVGAALSYLLGEESLLACLSSLHSVMLTELPVKSLISLLLALVSSLVIL